MRRAALTVMILAAFVMTAAVRADDPAALARRLGDADPLVREAATEDLWQLGESARPALASAAREAQSPEAAGRARLLLWRLDVGSEPAVAGQAVRLGLQARARDDEGVEGVPRSRTSPQSRRRARRSLAAAGQAHAPVIARLVVESLRDGDDEALVELWPKDEFGPAMVVAELLERDAAEAAARWLDLVAERAGDEAAMLHRAALLSALGRAEAASGERRGIESARARAVLRVWAGGGGSDDEASLEAVEAAGLTLPAVARAILAGDDAAARALAGRVDEPVARATLELILARLADEPAGVADAEAALVATLAEHPAPAEPIADEADDADDQKLQAARATVAAALLGRVDLLASHAEALDPAGLLWAHFDRYEFDAFRRLAEQHAQAAGERGERVRRLFGYLQQELTGQTRDAGDPPELSPAMRRRVAGDEALRRGDFAAADEVLAEAERRGVGDLGLRWQRSRALAGQGQAARAEAMASTARRAALAAPALRRSIAAEMWLLGEREAALEQLRQGAEWAALVPEEAYGATLAYAARLRDAGRHEASRRATLAAAAALLDADVGRAETARYRLARDALGVASELERVRMHLAIEAGDWAGAEAAWRRCVSLLPAASDPSIELVTALDAAGRAAQAEAVFEEAMRISLAALAVHGTAPQLNNRAAWTAAMCDRRLDAALRHAETAARAEPTSAAIADTLAEVLLRRGEADRALALMDRCLALAEAELMRVAQPAAAREAVIDVQLRRRDMLRRAGQAAE